MSSATPASHATLETALRRALTDGELDLAPPGTGRRAERWARLLEFGRRDLPFARMAEAHTDAVAMLHEAGRPAPAGTLYGVWAAEDPAFQLTLSETGPGRPELVLSGRKAFCTGASLVDRALVTVGQHERSVLVDVDVRAGGVSFDDSLWQTPAFEKTHTATARFDCPVQPSDLVGPPGWYLERVGFWHGACGPAACWAGGAIGLVDDAHRVAATKAQNPHLLAQLGALAALEWEMRAILDAAGRGMDADRHHPLRAMQRALCLRHTVERAVSQIVDLYGRAMGPQRLISAAIAQRTSEVQLYVRQHHGERDLEALGRSFL